MQERDKKRDDATRDVPSGETGRVLRFSSLAPGALFADRYRIVESLGAGGSGEVFRAKDQVAGHDIALKVLFPRASDGDDHLDRPRRELGILRDLSHPGIVRVFDMGEHDGLVYLVMELLEGETLRTRLERVGRMSEDEALGVLRGALDALSAAHEAGVVHRDVKPGNIFLSRSDEEDERVVLLDFGLARRSADATLTATGAFLGTPEYVSPEQARGEEKIGPASDLYSLGVTIWEALEGRTPFEGVSQMEILRLKLAGDSPFETRAADYATRASAAFLRTLLRDRPFERPPSARDALDALHVATRGGARAWLALLAGRRRTRARRTKFVLPIVLISLVAAPLALVPVDATSDTDAVVLHGLFGQRIARVDAGGAISTVVPAPNSSMWKRYYLVGSNEDGRVRVRRARSGVLRFDAWLRSFEPLYLRQSGQRMRISSGFDEYDDFMGSVKLYPLDDRNRITRAPLFAVTFQHSGHFPSFLAIADQDGTVVIKGWHAGDIRSLVPLIGNDSARLAGVSAVARAVGNHLSNRTVILGVPSAAGEGAGEMEFPPFRRRTVASGRHAPYVLFLSEDASETGLIVDKGRGIVSSRGRIVLEFDPGNGVPLSSEHRGGLSAREWTERHDQLIELLARASMAAGDGLERVARELEEYGLDETSPIPERGVALHRAGELQRRLGLLERGLRNARLARDLEPALIGHARLDIDMTFRLEGWDALLSTHLLDPGPASNVTITQQVAAMAALLAEDDEPSVKETLANWAALLNGPERVRSTEESHGYFDRWSKVWMRLHFAGEEIVDAGAAFSERERTVYPEYAFLAALEELVYRAQNARFAYELIAPHETQFGGGALAPIVPLRAFLAARGQGEAPSREQVDEALEAQRAAGREDLRSLYWVPWGYALAAGAAREEGDMARYRELRAIAEGEPGAGPWLDSLLSD